jgi:hypothetical protein
MNHGKYIIHEKVFTSVNLLPKYLEAKIKASTSSVFYLNLLVVSVWTNMYDNIEYLHLTL